MKDPRTAGRTRTSAVTPPSMDQLRAAAARRSVAPRTDRALSRLVAHLDSLRAGRPTVSPAKARGGVAKLGKPGSFGLPD